MVLRLFSGDSKRNTNPNSKIFDIEPEYGDDEDDMRLAMIGDATMRHVQGLSTADRQLWQEYKPFPDGNIYRYVPNWEDNDPDPENLKGQDLQEYIDRFSQGADETTMAAIQEAVENELDRRRLISEYNEDDPEFTWEMSHEELGVIPYQDWKDYTVPWKDVDIPSTPKDKAIPIGTSKLWFYDVFPQGHPNENIINKYLSMLNRKWPLDVDIAYANYICQEIENERGRVESYVKLALMKLAVSLTHDDVDPYDAVEECLQSIDDYWKRQFKNQAAKKVSQQPVTQLLLRKEKEWEEDFKRGIAVDKKIRTFARTMFTNFKDEMTPWHWARYRSLKSKFAPALQVQGIDINRASRTQLKSRFGDKAELIWFARPFQSLGEAHAQNMLNGKDFSTSESGEKLILFIEKYAKQALEELKIPKLRQVQQHLIRIQRDQPKLITSNEWTNIWSYYNIWRSDIQRAINKEYFNE